MRLSLTFGLVLVLTGTGCAHNPLSAGELRSFRRPAFISRIEDDAGPRAEVFQADSAYSPKLEPLRLDAKEADRRLQAKLKAVSRFEIAERVRGTTAALLPKEPPWTKAVSPTQVAKVLQSYLVEEVPANPPDYDLLKPYGADAIVEFVIQRYGMRSSGGRAGAYIEGYGRLFRLGGGTLWHRHFRADQVSAEEPHLEPLRVGKDPQLFRQEMARLIDSVSAQFAEDLSPADRGAEAPPPEADAPPPAEGSAPATIEREKDALPPGELPDPD
jgi:hypothetical protein